MSFSAGSHDDEDIKILEVERRVKRRPHTLYSWDFRYYFLVGSVVRPQNCWATDAFCITLLFLGKSPALEQAKRDQQITSFRTILFF